MKALLSALIFIHGIVHLTGFMKAFKLADVRKLPFDISKTAGSFWLLTAVLFMVSSGLLLFNSRIWWIPLPAAIIVSQLLIAVRWSEVKFGTVANAALLIPLVLAVIGTLPSSPNGRYRAEVMEKLSPLPQAEVVGPESVSRLPLPVRRYLAYVGVIGKPAVTNFRAVFDGVVRKERNGNWIETSSSQYDFLDEPARFVYSRSSVLGVPVYGFIRYSREGVGSDVKIANIVSIADGRGSDVWKDEALIMFTDICSMAPSMLIDSSVKWEGIDSLTAKAEFSCRGETVSAVLHFNRKGELVNFLSKDRSFSPDGKSFVHCPWSMSFSDYGKFDGKLVAKRTDAIWHTPAGEFKYEKASLREIEYDCSRFK